MINNHFYTSVIPFAKQNIHTSLIFLCIQATSAGLFSISVITQLTTSYPVLLSIIDKILGLGGSLKCDYFWKIPYTEIFIKIFILIVIQFLILAGLFYIGGKLLGQKDSNFFSIISMMGSGSLISSIFLLISTAVFTISPLFVGFILLFNFLYTMLLNHIGIKEIFEINQNQNVFLTSLVYTAYFFLLNICILDSLNTSHI